MSHPSPLEPGRRQPLPAASRDLWLLVPGLVGAGLIAADALRGFRGR